MAEGFEPYHVPQQSRRDKLRIVSQNHPSVEPLQGCASLLPLYDTSLLPSDLLTCANPPEFQHHKNNNNNNQVCVVKEEGLNFMGFFDGISSSSTSNHPYLDPQSSLHINPSSVFTNANPFFSPPQNLRDFEQSYNTGEVVVFKPESSTCGGQGLSLSLSSHNTHQNNLPLGLNLQRYGGGYAIPGIVGGCASTSNEVSRSSVPLGPFTGYASILKGSRFLKPTQQLLEEICDVVSEICVGKIAPDSSLMEWENFSAPGIMDDPLGGENKRKKSGLLSMLEEVYGRYKQYYQQMQAVVASFECVAGLGNTAPYANLAVKAMSKHFRCLKNAITDQLQFTNKGHGQISPAKDNEAPRFGCSSDRSPYTQRPVYNSGYLEHQPVWRPQRGLPERAVTVLRAWLFEHFLHPYPTDTDKIMLAKQTGLSRNQVSNWFINARVRLWKPMVEEIHMLETRQTQKASQKEDQNAIRSSDDHLSSVNSIVSQHNSTSTQRAQDAPSKRTRSELPDIPTGSGPSNLSYNSLSNHPLLGVGVSMAGGSSGVSLTLGLHQSNGIGLSEPFPINLSQRSGLGLEVSSDGYVMGGFEAHNRHFGRDVVGGQLLRDFVG